MLIRIERNLRELSLWAVGDEVREAVGGAPPKGARGVRVHTVKDPRLVLDTAALLALPSVRRDLVMRLLDFPVRETEFDGVSVTWPKHRFPGVWSPTIDTLLLARALRPLLRARPPRTFLEIGCGSGFLSKYVLSKCRDAGSPVAEARLMDINPDALLSGMEALAPVQGDTLVSYSLNRAGRRIPESGPYDLVVCNPPYVPRPHADVNNPFEGLFLYGEIVRMAPRLLAQGSRLVLMLSSTSEAEVRPALARVFALRDLASLEVPLKIPVITARLSKESRRWMDYLEKGGRLLEDPTEKSGYRWWQRLTVVEARLPATLGSAGTARGSSSPSRRAARPVRLAR